MGQLSEPSTPASQQAGVAERDAAATILQTQASGAEGNRSDTAATQVQGSSRGLEFNPANEPAPASGLPASGAASAGAQPAAAASGVASEYEGVRDYARGRGVDVAGFADDNALMNTLLERYHRGTQEDYYAQLGRQLAPQAPAIQNYLREQRQPQQPAAPQEWEAPPFDERWGQMVDRDPLSGIYLGKPGTPPEIVQAVNKYADYQKKYASNPLAAVRPYVESTVPDMINKAVEARLGAYQREQTVNQIVQQNASWMYTADAQGRITMGVGGRPVPTPAGMRYATHVQYLEAQGLRDPAVVDQLARQLLSGEMAAAQQQQHQAGNPTEAQRQQALASGRPQANPLQSFAQAQRQITPGATEPEQVGASLHDQLKHALDTNGFTDADFQDLDTMR